MPNLIIDSPEAIAARTDYHAFGPCTIYFSGEMMGNFHKIECRSAEIWRSKYAQYNRAICCRFLQKGQRKHRGLTQTYKPSLLILAGHNHPEPDGLFPEAAPGEMLVKGRHSSFSGGWQSDFDAMIGKHIAASNGTVIVLADFRWESCQ